MGWTKGTKGTSVIGDDGLDAVTFGLMDLGATLAKAQQPQPSLAELLAAMEEVLKQDPARYLAADPRLGRLSYRRQSAPPRPAAAPGPAVLQAMSEILGNLRIAYQQGVDRPPVLQEVLDTFAAVLGADPAKYLRDGKSLSIAAGDLVNAAA